MTKRLNTILKKHHRLIILGILFWIPVVIFMKLAGEIIEKEPLPFDVPMMLAIHAHATEWWNSFLSLSQILVALRVCWRSEQ